MPLYVQFVYFLKNILHSSILNLSILDENKDAEYKSLALRNVFCFDGL